MHESACHKVDHLATKIAEFRAWLQLAQVQIKMRLSSLSNDITKLKTMHAMNYIISVLKSPEHTHLLFQEHSNGKVEDWDENHC